MSQCVSQCVPCGETLFQNQGLLDLTFSEGGVGGSGGGGRLRELIRLAEDPPAVRLWLGTFALPDVGIDRLHTLTQHRKHGRV